MGQLRNMHNNRLGHVFSFFYGVSVIKNNLFTQSLYFFQDNSHAVFQHQCVRSNPATHRSPNPSYEVQIEVHPESHSTDPLVTQQVSLAATSLQSPSSGRAEPAGFAPTRCLSPNSTPSRHGHKCGPGDSMVVDKTVEGKSSVSLMRRLLQEVKLDDFTQHKVLFMHTIRTT